VDGEQIFHPPKRPAFFSKIDNGFCGGRADAGNLLQFGGGGRIQIDGLRRRCFFLRAGPPCRNKKQKRNGKKNLQPRESAF
jgi:hypothetical protein